jgi:hypothetical protein
MVYYHVQKSAPCPCPKTDYSSSCHPSYFFRSILVSFSNRHLGLPSGLLSIFPTKTLYAPLLCQYMPHAMAILLSLTYKLYAGYLKLYNRNSVSKVYIVAVLLYSQFVATCNVFTPC